MESTLAENKEIKREENKEEKQYLELLEKVYQDGTIKPNRTGNTSKSIFGNMMKFTLYDKVKQKRILPLLTTKNMTKSAEIIFHELFFFINGQTNNKLLQEKGIKIWNGNTSREYLDSVGLTHYQEGDLGCFIAGMKILTNDGYKNIEEIDMNNKLYTHRGNWNSINHLQKRSYSGFLYKIKTDYHPLEIICTPNHPFLCINYLIKNKYKERKNCLTSEISRWFRADELNKNNSLVGFKIENREVLPRFNSKVLDKKNEWQMMGYFLSNGWLSNFDRICFIFNNRQKDYVETIENILNIRSIKNDEFYTTYICFSKDYFDILKQFETENLGKKIPEWIQRGPKALIKEFLNGFILASGNESSLSSATTNLITLSLEVAYGIQRLYLKLGYLAKISLHKDQQEYYLIEIPEIKWNTYSYIDKNRNIAWFSINSIKTEIVENIHIYNFEVANDHSYTVHNISVKNSSYGYQWRHFGADYKDCVTNYSGQGYDQLQTVINEIKINPYSRRLLVSAWNPPDLKKTCLPPCHIMFQFNVEPDELNSNPKYLSCSVYQRSADLPLGVPFNIASYATLTHMIADLTNLIPKELIYFTGDNHIYSNQLNMIQNQISRSPYPFPNLEFIYDSKPTDITEYKFEHLQVENYLHWSNIIYPFSI